MHFNDVKRYLLQSTSIKNTQRLRQTIHALIRQRISHFLKND